MSIPAVELEREDQGDAQAPPLRFVSAASLFDGHDAAINIIRRLLQAHGAEVVHLGHNRSVADIVRAAIQEDADGIAVSSYQGGHNEYFRYMVDMLREQRRRAHPRGRRRRRHDRAARDRGAGGLRRREDLHARGRPHARPRRDDRRRVQARARGAASRATSSARSNARDHQQLARAISVLEGAAGVRRDRRADPPRDRAEAATPGTPAPVIGITGTGGAGKSIAQR